MADNFNFNPSGDFLQIPAPVWELGTVTNMQTLDGYGFTGKRVAARVGLLPENTQYTFAVQYGRVKRNRYTWKSTLNRHGARIVWFSDWDGTNSVTGTGYGGGQHTSVSLPRRNMFPVQKSDLAGELEYNLFYVMRNVMVWNGSSSQIISAPHMTGGRISRAGDISQFGTGGSFFGKRPRLLADSTHMQSVWYARIVVWENNRIVGYSPNSEPLFVKPNALPYIENTGAYSGTTNFGTPAYNCDYVFTHVKVAIGEYESN